MNVGPHLLGGELELQRAALQAFVASTGVMTFLLVLGGIFACGNIGSARQGEAMYDHLIR